MCGAKPIFADVMNRPSISTRYRLRRCNPEDQGNDRGTPLRPAVRCSEVSCRICESHNLKLIEDAAQAHGALYKSTKIGGFGNFGCFSFYATKNMTTGEGGMVTTSDKVYNERLRLLINHGQSEKYLHTRLGYNYRMTDVAAAIGLVQLRKLDKFNIRRRKNAEFYDSHISVKGLITPSAAPGVHHVYHQYVIRLTDEFPMKRGDFMEYLKLKGIGTAVHYPIPIHHQPVYARADEPDSCPVATRLASSVLSIPVHPLLDQKELAYICDAINQVR